MKMILALAVFVVSSTVFASSAAQYTCVGKNVLSGESVVYDVVFAGGNGVQGTTVSIVAEGGVVLEDYIVLQYAGTTKKTSCTENSDGEIQLSSANFVMEPTKAGNLAPYEISFKSLCANREQYDVSGYCFAQ